MFTLFLFLGWSGAGLGKSQQGIHNPISGGEVRDKFDKFKVCAWDICLCDEVRAIPDVILLSSRLFNAQLFPANIKSRVVRGNLLNFFSNVLASWLIFDSMFSSLGHANRSYVSESKLFRLLTQDNKNTLLFWSEWQMKDMTIKFYHIFETFYLELVTVRTTWNICYLIKRGDMQSVFQLE